MLVLAAGKLGGCSHWYNWGVLLPAIVLPENQPVMAHFYDNGSSLGANLMPERLRRYIADTDQQDRFDRNFKYEMRLDMDRKPSPRELLAFLGDLNRGLFGLREELIKMKPETIDAVVGTPPVWLVDKERVEFARILVRKRRELILQCTEEAR